MKNNLKLKLLVAVFVISTTFITSTGSAVHTQDRNASFNYFEPGYQLIALKNSPASIVEFAGGRNFGNSVSAGLVAHILLSGHEILSEGESWGISRFLNMGPQVMYDQPVSTRISLTAGGSAGFGITDYSAYEAGESARFYFDAHEHKRGADFPSLVVYSRPKTIHRMMTIRSEAGFRIRISELMRMSITTNLSYIHIFNKPDDLGIFPGIRAGLRLGK